jgi:hypothetical protein
MNQNIYIYDAIDVINEWKAKLKPYYWEETPNFVIGRMLQNCERNNYKFINYHEAVKILQEAETTKMTSHANGGMEWIKQEWKKLYRGLR